MKGGSNSLRALVLAPGGRDAAVAVEILSVAGLAAKVCSDVAALRENIEAGAGLAVVVEEALLDADLGDLQRWVGTQPTWSDFPFIILTLRSGVPLHPLTAALEGALGNVSFVERPFQPASLVSLARSALRGRRRQYDARKRLDELALGQEQLRFAQEAGRIGTFELDAQTRTVQVSPTFCRIWGLPVQPSIALADLVALLPSDDRLRVRTADPDLRDDALEYLEYRVQRPDTGETRWIARQGEPVVEPATGTTRYFGVVYDITERRRAEEALRESEQRFRLIADSAPLPMWVTRLDRKREFVNRAYSQFVGRSYDEALEFDWRNIIHPDDQARMMREQVEKEASLQPFSLEARYRNADGDWRWVRSESQPRFDGEGHHSGFIGIAYDITASKIAAAEMHQLNDTLEREVEARTALLRAREAQLRTMFETTYQLQGLLALDGRLLEANTRALQAMDTTLDGVRGQPFWTLPLWEGTGGAERVRAAVDAAAAGGTFREEITIDLAAGQRTFDLLLRPLASEGEGDDNALIFFEALEVTERRAAEDQLRQSLKMEALGQLTGGIAHDFNNLLTGITGSLDLIQRRMKAGRVEGIERFMEAAIASAQRAASLTHRLLAFARRQSLDTKSTDVNALVQGLEDLLRRTLGESMTLRTTLDDRVWPAMSDANQLETALVNLAINARDAMPEGGVLTVSTGNVTLRTQDLADMADVPAGDYVAIRVTDTGAGMSPDVIAKAFDPFFTTKPIGQGTGLGLSMVYGFLKQSGGFVDITSTEGQGTTVTLFLSRAVEVEATETVAASAAEPRGKGETVLLVEDDNSVRLLMIAVLEEFGYSYMDAPDARTAIPILQSGVPIDLLVTDVGLPHVNGRQLAEIARQTRPDLKVLFVTGYAEGARVRGGFLAPGMEMIAKPFALDELGARIRALIG